MKRLLMLSALALLLLGPLSGSVNSLDRPWSEIEWEQTSGSSSDHPWGGDNVTPGGTPGGTTSRSSYLHFTGIGPVDLVINVYFSKFASRRLNTVRNDATVTTPNTGTTITTGSSTTSGMNPTVNQ